MLFLVIAISVGWIAKRIWRTVAVAALAYGAIFGPINMILAQQDRAWFGGSIDWSVRNIAVNVAGAGGWFFAIALVTYGFRKLVRHENLWRSPHF